MVYIVFFFKQKTAYEMRISDWSADVCSSDLTGVSVGGRGFRLDPTVSLARHDWLAVAETQGMAAGARILSAAPIDAATVEMLFGDRIETRRTVAFDPADRKSTRLNSSH